ncbi:hypothetical protein Tco_1236803 [Tanacetum coccineum]
MHTRSQTRNFHNQQHQAPPPVVEQFNLEEPIENPDPLAPMDDTRTMAQLLEAPTAGYEDAIVVPEIAADNFELKHGLLNLVQNKQFFGHDKEDPHAHIRYFNKITSTMKFPNVPTWDRFNDLLRACPHHGFSELHQLDTFYNALNSNDQDSLNSAAGGNFLDKMPRDCLRIIESKSKVRNSRNKPVVAKVSSSTSTPGISSEVAELKDMVKALLLDKKNQSPAPTPVKAVEESCVTCGGAHSYQTCPATSGNVYRDNIQEYVSQAAAANYNQGNTGYRAPISNQIRPPGFPPVQNNHNVQNQGNNQNRYNQNRGNFNQAPAYQPPVHQGQIYRPQVVQPPAYQAPAYQAPAPQTQGVSKTDFDSYVKANDAVMRNMQNQNQVLQTQGQNLQTQLNNLATSNQRLESMLGNFIKMNTASTSGTLPSNTVTNPKEDLKADYNHMTANRIDVIDMACEEYSQEVLGFSDVIANLKICEANRENSSVNEPPELELKDLPPHLEYAFLEGDDKLPVIIAKDLKNEEKAALIEEDYEQRLRSKMGESKIHDVIKKEVEKLLDAGLIYPISDSPWVSPVHCVPKKGGMTVVKNDDNDLIPTRLVTGWRVCIDYRKLNEATRKDHFPLPFMDQMLERLAGNQFYCFLDGFSGYFQIPIDPKDQEKDNLTCPYELLPFATAFGLCMLTGTFQRLYDGLSSKI